MQQAVQDYESFKHKILKKTGLDLGSYKQTQMERRLRSFMERAGAASFGDYYRLMEQNEKLLHEFMNRVTINVSEMFRNPEHFHVLERVVIPDLLTRSRSLRVWSAGCSFGQEPYTLAMCLQEAACRFGHTVLATDIDARALQNTRDGAFDQIDAKNLSPDRLRRWFKDENGKIVADQRLRSTIEVRRLDLLNDPFPTGMDLILCRNVVIYFTEQAKDGLYRRFYSSLKPGGYLFVGGTERIYKYSEMGYESPHPFFYQKPLR